MTQKKNYKIWTATKDSQAGLMLTEKEAVLVANRSNFVAATPIGIALNGNSIAMNTTSENIKNGGIFNKMNDIVQLIPTTLVTPMPAQVPFPPLAFASEIVQMVPFFLAMVAGVAIGVGVGVASNNR